MKKTLPLVAMLLLLVPFLCGCNTVQANAAAIQASGQVGGYYACTQIHDQTAITLMRQELVSGALPLLASTTPEQAQQAETAIFGPLLAHLGPQYRIWITPALTILGGFYAPATPDAVLSPTDIVYLTAFTTGIIQGIDMYNSGLVPVSKTFKGAAAPKRLPPYFFHGPVEAVPAKTPPK